MNMLLSAIGLTVGELLAATQSTTADFSWWLPLLSVTGAILSTYMTLPSLRLLSLPWIPRHNLLVIQKIIPKAFTALCVCFASMCFGLKYSPPDNTPLNWANYSIANEADDSSRTYAYIATAISEVERRKAGEVQFLATLMQAIPDADREERRDSDNSAPSPYPIKAQVKATARAPYLPAVVLLKAPDLPWSDVSNLRSGSRIAIVAKPTRWRSTNNIFSYEHYLLRRGIRGVAYVQDIRLLDETTRSTPPTLTQMVLETLSNRYPRSESAGILLAATIGRTDMLSEHVINVFRSTGTLHILVVSGYHVTIIYLVVYTALRYLFCLSPAILYSGRLRMLATLGGLASTFLFIYAIGLSPPCLRALFGVSIFAISKLAYRKLRFWNSLVLSYIVVNLFWPGSFAESGVQLTFTAISGLVIGSNLWQKLLAPRLATAPYLIRTYLQHLTICTAAWLFTSPILYCWFGTVSLIAPIANSLLNFPFTALTVSLGLIAIILVELNVPGSVMLLDLAVYSTYLLFAALEWTAETGV